MAVAADWEAVGARVEAVMAEGWVAVKAWVAGAGPAGELADVEVD